MSLFSKTIDKKFYLRGNIFGAIAGMMILSPFAAHASTLVFRAEFDSTLEQVSQIGTAHNADFTFHDSHVNLVAVFGAGRFTDGLDIGQTRRGSLSIYEAASGALSVECLLAGAGGGDYCRDYHASSGSVLAAYAVSDLAFPFITPTFSPRSKSGLLWMGWGEQSEPSQAAPFAHRSETSLFSKRPTLNCNTTFPCPMST